MRFAVKLVLFTSLLRAGLCLAEPNQPPVEELRQRFLQAEKLITQNQDDDYIKLSETLKNYPLYPYLQYQWLKNHLDDGLAVENFIAAYPQSRYAQLLRQKWLQDLGKKQQWQALIGHYHNSEDPELQCYYAQALFQSGRSDTAFDAVRKLWINGKSLPAACDPVFTAFQLSPDFNTSLIWQRFKAALNLDNQALAENLLSLLTAPEKTKASLWLKLHRQPNLVQEAGDWKQTYPQAGRLFAHAISRWLNTDPASALETWDAEKQSFMLPVDVTADLEKQLALALALKHDSRAYDRLAQLTNKDDSSREWQVRAALYQQNWEQVEAAFNAMTDAEKHQDRWQYWQARALTERGNLEAANAVFKNIAKNRSFYGFLAADKLQQPIELADRPLDVSPSEIDWLQHQTEFQVVAELLAIDRKAELKKQWWHAVAGLDSHGLAVAAKLAQQWRLPAIAIFSIAKAGDWDDLDLRFPLQYTDQIQSFASQHQLDPAILLGLIRQESAFDELADSPAGAKGLMQIMPKTAEQIAAELQDGWQGESSLFNPDRNLKYGSFYYKKLLRQFNGYHLLAAAAYNAGANKVKRWLPQNNALPGDIWIETIPYKETRGYVTSVLQYALIYQRRLQRNGFKAGELIPRLNPG